MPVTILCQGKKIRVFGKGNDTARRGLATHLAVTRRLVERGYEVLQPFGDYLRYDLACYIPADSGQEAYLKKAKNNQEKGIIWAKDYEL